MAKVNWNSVIDTLQAVLVWFVIILIGVSVMVLVLFDVLAGAGVMWIFTQGKTVFAFIISLATTGLMMGLAFIGYTLQKNGLDIGGKLMFGVSFLVFLLDTYFDMLGADVLRYGVIWGWHQIDNNQIAYRSLIGGISVIGEAMAISIILGMPVLKDLIQGALPLSQRYTASTPPRQVSSTPTYTTRPTPRPTQQNRPDNYPTYHTIGTQRRDANDD